MADKGSESIGDSGGFSAADYLNDFALQQPESITRSHIDFFLW